MTEINSAAQNEKQSAFMLMANRDLLSVIFLGGIIGVVTWGLSWLLGTYVYDAILCGGGDTCRASPEQFGEVTAAIVASVVGLVALVRLRVFRPLLVVIAAMASLWGLAGMLEILPWYWAMIASIGTYALAYGLFVWIVRIRQFLICLILVILLIVAIRFVMTT